MIVNNEESMMNNTRLAESPSQATSVDMRRCDFVTKVTFVAD
jgi:hypothetical protein